MLLKNTYTYFISFFLGISVLSGNSLFSMDSVAKTVRSPLKDVVLYNPDIQPTILKELDAALAADEANVFVDSFILNDLAIVNRIIKLHRKNPGSVSVHVHESNTHNKKTLALLRSSAVPVHASQQHAKRIVIAYHYNSEDFWRRRVIAGSYNLTNNAPNNQEVMIAEYNDSPAHAQHTKSHDQGKKRIRQPNFFAEVLPTTPVKKTVIDNSTHDLLASAARCIGNTKENGTLYFASMNYGDVATHHALVTAAKNNVLVHMLLDVDATNAKNIPLLDELDKLGVHIVLPTAKHRMKQGKQILDKSGICHMKYFVRECEGKILTCISTANATDHADKDFNVAAFYPNQEELAKKIITQHQQLATKGMTYATFKATGAVLQKRKKSAKKKLALPTPDSTLTE